MIQLGKTPSQLIDYLYSIVGPHYYDRIDVRTSAQKREAIRDRVSKAQPQSIAGLKVTDIDTLDGFRYSMEDGGWLLIRFSGTEPLIRIYTETTHQDKLQEILSAGREIAGL
jgi:phosphomannomutase